MTMVRGRQEDRQGPEPEVEGEIRELVRRDVAQLRKPESAGEMGVSNLNALIQRVSGTSVLEIEKLIAELQRLRDYLQHEDHRGEPGAVEAERREPQRARLTSVFRAQRGTPGLQLLHTSGECGALLASDPRPTTGR